MRRVFYFLVLVLMGVSCMQNEDTSTNEENLLLSVSDDNWLAKYFIGKYEEQFGKLPDKEFFYRSMLL